MHLKLLLRKAWLLSMNLFQKVFGTHSERELKRIEATVQKIEDLRPSMMELSDEALAAKTEEFKKRLAEGETLDDLLPEAYAVVRETAFASRSICSCKRNCKKSIAHRTLSCAAYRWYYSSPRTYCRNENR